MTKLFVTGIGTGVGKTIISAAICEGLNAVYWKPIQCGSLANSDTEKVKRLLGGDQSRVMPEAYRFSAPLAPSIAARIENVEVDLRLRIPKVSRSLVIEGAGGLMVPLNNRQTFSDLISGFHVPVVVVVKNYLGCINHTLLTLSELNRRKIRCLGIVVSGAANEDNENAIEELGKVKIIARLPRLRRISRKALLEAIPDFASELTSALKFAEL